MIKTILISNILSWVYVMQIESKGTAGIMSVAITALAGTIVALWLYAKQQAKEIKEAHKESANKVENIYDKTIKQLTELSEKNTNAFNQNTTQTKMLERSLEELSRAIREKMK